MEKIMLVISTVSLIIIACSQVILVIKSIEDNYIKEKIVRIIKIFTISLLTAILMLTMFRYVKNNNITASYKEISIEEYYKINKSKKKEILLITSSTCSYCEKFDPIIKKVQKNLKITVNSFNTTNIKSDEEWKLFQKANAYLNSEDWGTPLLIIINEGKVVDTLSGFVEEPILRTFLSTNGFE